MAYPNYATNLIDYMLNLTNPKWDGFKNAYTTADYVPGGRYYAVAGGFGPENTKAQPQYKIVLYYGNASRFEYTLQIVFKLTQHNTTSVWLRAGIGPDTCDLWCDEDNIGIDGKVYYSYASCTTYVIDLLVNKNNLKIEDWTKAINKLFHSDGAWLLAFDDTAKTCYQIRRPLQPISEEELNNNKEYWISDTKAFIPNVIIDPITHQYSLDYTHYFSLIICDSDPAVEGAKVYYHNYKGHSEY